MGNICRSPSAEAVFTQLVASKGQSDAFLVDSAGTISYHAGSEPDHRSRLAAKKRGLAMDHMRARQVKASDYAEFDWMVVMDEENRDSLLKMFPDKPQEKVISMMNFVSGSKHTEVPDPYYGEGDGFELVLDLLTIACGGLYEFLTENKTTQL